MNIDSFYPTKILSGRDCVKNNAALFGTLGRRAMVITGKSGAKASGALDDVVGALKSAGVPFSHFDEIGANPTLASCVRAARLIKVTDADFVIAVGGGSVMDAAKAAALLALNGPDETEAIFTDKTLGMLPLICVGTTAGTGSEANWTAIITMPDGKKRSISGNPRVYATYSFCDPRYTFSLDLRGTVSTGLDALCHGLESIFKTTANEVSRLYARECVTLVYPELKKLAGGFFEPEDLEFRERLLYGSVFGGMAIKIAGTSYPHPSGYVLTELTGLPHGAACALFIEDFIDRVASTGEWDFGISDVDELKRVVRVLTKNDVSISPDLAKRHAQRVAATANVTLTQGVAPNDVPEILAKYVNQKQTEDIKGGWTYGL